MATPSLRNETVKVGQLVADYRAGRLVIPEFQRDYVWHKSRAPKLIDSLFRNYPISTLLLWRSSEYAKARRSNKIPPNGRTMSWLIDGQQRVITLSRVMSGDEGIEVLFNAQGEEFRLANVATRHDSNWVRVADLLDDATFRELRRNLPEGPRGAQLEERFEKVRAIRDYEVPVVVMVDHHFADAVDAFTRINSLGMRLKKQDIESARIAARHSGLIADEVVPFMERLETAGLRRLTVMHLFRVCAFLAKPDGRSRTPLHELERNDVLNAWKRTEQATLAAGRLTHGEFGHANIDTLCSGALLVPVIAMVATKRRDEIDPKAMMGWLALAALLHRYSQATEVALDQDLRACRAEDPIGALLSNLRQARTPLLSRPGDFTGALNDRGALLAAVVACNHRGMKDLFTGKDIAAEDDIERHHILPRRAFEEDVRSRADNVANIAFVAADGYKAPPRSAVFFSEIEPAILESQCVPGDRSLWTIERAEEFFAARRSLLATSFNEFLREALPNRRLVG